MRATIKKRNKVCGKLDLVLNGNLLNLVLKSNDKEKLATIKEVLKQYLEELDYTITEKGNSGNQLRNKEYIQRQIVNNTKLRKEHVKEFGDYSEEANQGGD